MKSKEYEGIIKRLPVQIQEDILNILKDKNIVEIYFNDPIFFSAINDQESVFITGLNVVKGFTVSDDYDTIVFDDLTIVHLIQVLKAIELNEYEVIEAVEVFECLDCGWVGTEIKTSMQPNLINDQDKTLYEVNICPDCNSTLLTEPR